MAGRRTDGAGETNVALEHPYHEGKSCSRFGQIPSTGLGGDRVMDGRADGCVLSLLLL